MGYWYMYLVRRCHTVLTTFILHIFRSFIRLFHDEPGKDW